MPGQRRTKNPRCVLVKWLCRVSVGLKIHAESSSNGSSRPAPHISGRAKTVVDNVREASCWLSLCSGTSVRTASLETASADGDVDLQEKVRWIWPGSAFAFAVRIAELRVLSLGTMPHDGANQRRGTPKDCSSGGFTSNSQQPVISPSSIHSYCRAVQSELRGTEGDWATQSGTGPTRMVPQSVSLGDWSLWTWVALFALETSRRAQVSMFWDFGIVLFETLQRPLCQLLRQRQFSAFRHCGING